VPAIVGFGKACEICVEKMKYESERIRLLRNKLYEGLTSQLDDVILNGSFENRLPGNLNLCFKYVKAEILIMELRDIAVSTGSACTSTTLKPSHVLKAIGLSDQFAQSSIRFGLGRYNTEEEIDFTIDRVVKTVKKLRNFSPEFDLKEETLLNLDK
jgi:cysteine desulfurase